MWLRGLALTEVISQLDYMILLCPFQQKTLFYSILVFVWTEAHSISKSCAQWRLLHIYTAPVGSIMPLVVPCWVWMWTNVCISALHWPRCPWLQCLCSGGWQSSVPWTTADAASEFVLLSRAGKRFFNGTSQRKAESLHWVLTAAYVSWMGMDIKIKTSAGLFLVWEIIEPKH